MFYEGLKANLVNGWDHGHGGAGGGVHFWKEETFECAKAHGGCEGERRTDARKEIGQCRWNAGGCEVRLRSNGESQISHRREPGWHRAVGRQWDPPGVVKIPGYCGKQVGGEQGQQQGHQSAGQAPVRPLAHVHFQHTTRF